MKDIFLYSINADKINTILLRSREKIIKCNFSRQKSGIIYCEGRRKNGKGDNGIC